MNPIGYIIIGATVLLLWAACREVTASRAARTRRIVKWAGLVVCVVILAWWVVRSQTCMTPLPTTFSFWRTFAFFAILTAILWYRDRRHGDD